jgi:hypothetical protein
VTRYSHTQRSRWLVFVAVPFGVLMVGAAVFGDPLPATVRAAFIALSLVFVWIMVNFSRLTVEVTHEILVRFGRRWPRRMIDPSAITATRVVRNSPWYGWGIRWIRKGSLWNVWGLDAVELDLANGRRFRIGTDEPDELLAAIRTIVRTS